MFKPSSFRLIAVIGIATCIILVSYKLIERIQKTNITLEDSLPTNQQLILFSAYLYQDELSPSLYFLNVDTGKVGKWNAIDNFKPRTVRLISWSEEKNELLLTGSLQGDDINQLYSVKSDGTYTLLSKTPSSNEWMPDNKRLIWFSGGKLTLLNDDAYFRKTAIISPDGKWLAFDWCIDLSCAIYRTDINGQNLLKLTQEFDPSLISIRWSPDSTKIAFVELRGALPSMLWVVNIDGTSPSPVTETEGNFAWSSNSAQIAFTSEKNGFEYTYISMGGKSMGMEFTAYTHSLYVFDLVTKSVQRMTYLRNVVTSQIMWLR